MTDYPIQTVLGSATKIRVTNNGFMIGITNAFFRFELINSTGQLVAMGTLHMPAAVFENWGTSDEYVVNWVCTQLGITRIQNTN